MITRMEPSGCWLRTAFKSGIIGDRLTARRRQPPQHIIIRRGLALFMALAACVGAPRFAAAQTIRRAPQANLAAPPARPIQPAPNVRAVDTSRELVVSVDF